MQHPIPIDPDVDLQATDLPGSGSLKRLAAATGLTAYAEDPGVPFPRPEVLTSMLLLRTNAVPPLGGQGRRVTLSHSVSALHMAVQCLSHDGHNNCPLVKCCAHTALPCVQRRSLFAQKSGNAKLPDPIRTNERPKVPLWFPSSPFVVTNFRLICSEPSQGRIRGRFVSVSSGQLTSCNAAAPVRVQLTPEEEKRRKEVIKIYEEAKAEAAKEEEKKVGTTCTTVPLQYSESDQANGVALHVWTCFLGLRLLSAQTTHRATSCTRIYLPRRVCRSCPCRDSRSLLLPLRWRGTPKTRSG